MNPEIKLVTLDLIRQDPKNPRGSKLQKSDVQDLLASIPQIGLINPITVIDDFPGFMVVAGARRLFAYQLLQEEARAAGQPTTPFDTIQVIVRQFASGLDVFQMQISENDDRLDVQVVEKAKALQRIATEHKLSQAEMARLMGKSVDHVSKLLTVAGADEVLQALLVKHELDLGDAVVLVRLAGLLPESRKESTLKRLAEQRADGSLSRDELRQYLADTRPGKKKTPEAKKTNRFFATEGNQGKAFAFVVDEKLVGNDGHRTQLIEQLQEWLTWLAQRYPAVASELRVDLGEAIRPGPNYAAPVAG